MADLASDNETNLRMNEPTFPVNLKNRLPFRLGTTSYIIPAGLLENVEFLAPYVDDVELVLFDSGGICNYPDMGEVAALRDLAAEHALTFTVHLPVDARLNHVDESIRARSVEEWLRVIDLTAPLEPFAYVAHLDGDRRGGSASDDVPAWRERLSRSVGELLKSGVPPDMICVESLDYPLEFIEEIIFDHGLSICLDVGHLVYYGHPFARNLDRYLKRARVIHLHGVEDGHDHRGAHHFPPEKLEMLLERLRADAERDRVVTLEVFDLEDFQGSLTALDRRPAAR